MEEEKKNKRGIYQMVEFVLEHSETARDSDEILTTFIWETYYSEYCYEIPSKHVRGFTSYDIIYNLPSFQTISRCRRYIQNNEKRFLPTSEAVRKKRGIKEEEYHKMASNGMQQEFFTKKIK